eukprot:231188-Hanusia_phi.AAC.1
MSTPGLNSGRTGRFVLLLDSSSWEMSTPGLNSGRTGRFVLLLDTSSGGGVYALVLGAFYARM